MSSVTGVFANRAKSEARLDLLALALPAVEEALSRALREPAEHRPEDGPSDGHRTPPRLAAAMRHAVLVGGKRLRPALAMGGAVAVGAAPTDALVVACAVEMVHAYSLVHDDLPALDNDAVRRGQPACHVAFGEATALLAGDALVTEALGLVADDAPFGDVLRPPADRRARATVLLTRAAGAAGMVGGQHDDLVGGDEKACDATARELVAIHRRKTGRLIQASVVLGALYTRGADQDLTALGAFGANVGLAFQLIDDVLDGDGLAAVWGRDETRRRARELTDTALGHLERFGVAAEPLAHLARTMVGRTT